MRSLNVTRSSPLRRKLERAVVQGATLASLAVGASCAADDRASKERSPNDLTTPDATPDAAAADSTTEVVIADAQAEGQAPESLPPYDLERLGCWGPHYDGGYMGQCCVQAHCYSPEAGAGCASAAQIMARAHSLPPPFPSGSGTCTCKLGEGASEHVAGPFAANSADPSRPNGGCCYLVGSIGCVGRPLVVDGIPLVADLVARNDWAPYA